MRNISNGADRPLEAVRYATLLALHDVLNRLRYPYMLVGATARDPLHNVSAFAFAKVNSSPSVSATCGYQQPVQAWASQAIG